MQIQKLTINDVDTIVELTQHLNPTIDKEVLRQRHIQMFDFDHYHCFGIYTDDELIAVSSGWITVRLYSGKQLEVDNLIVNPNIQSKGIGKQFVTAMEKWAIEQGCETVELNTYVQNGRSHKFYYNLGYNILGFHFLKWLGK